MSIVTPLLIVMCRMYSNSGYVQVILNDRLSNTEIQGILGIQGIQGLQGCVARMSQDVLGIPGYLVSWDARAYRWVWLGCPSYPGIVYMYLGCLLHPSIYVHALYPLVYIYLGEDGKA